MRRRNGKKLAKVVGARGIAFNQDRNITFDVFGYPAEERLRRRDRCSAATPRPTARTTRLNDPKPTRISCDQTGGSSGGGWVIGGGRVNSVVSYGYECGHRIPLPIPCDNAEEGNLFGPYFGNDIKQLYRAEKR